MEPIHARHPPTCRSPPRLTPPAPPPVWTHLPAERQKQLRELLGQLLARLRASGVGAMRISKVHPEEISTGLLEALGFRPASRHLLYAAQAGVAQAVREAGATT